MESPTHTGANCFQQWYVNVIKEDTKCGYHI